MKRIASCFALSWLLLPCASALAAHTANVPVQMMPEEKAAPVPLPAELPLQFPTERNIHFSSTNEMVWIDADSLQVAVTLPTNAPSRVRALAWFKDRDDFWHQYLLPQTLVAGTTNLLSVPLAADAAGWNTPGHSAAWHYRVRIRPQSVGVRLFAYEDAFTGSCQVVSAHLVTRPPSGAPAISNIRQLTTAPRVWEKFELSFQLPDRYENPFDPSQVDVSAVIYTPSGATNTIHAFYYQPCYRLEDELGHPVEPDGKPEWRIRYCPREPGVYRGSLVARDKWGEVSLTEAVHFTAQPPAPGKHGFVRASAKDPRYFEFDDGAFYFPIGHNTRSASDSRMDDKFPWIFRRDEGPSVYSRYFKRMQENGEDWAEVWMSAWSLGLEWAEGIGGYHGVNDYHLGNAWELDQVLKLADRHGLRVNLVLNYHGRISSSFDPEWQHHPYNKVNARGWLTHSMEFFEDPQALEMQRRFIRYTQARWGWDPTVFSYELCSEVNLCGEKSHQKANFEPPIVKWTQLMGAYLKEIDLNRHLVTSHVSYDYRTWNPEICNMPEMTYNAVDAYSFSRAEYIAELCVATYNTGAGFKKPVLITEFGGSPMAAGMAHLLREQHLGIWSAACLPMGGIPMFWWWQVIDEQNLYPRYAAVRKFVEGQDFRDPAANYVSIPVGVKKDGNAARAKHYTIIATASQEYARGFLYAPVHQPAVPIDDFMVTLKNFKPGVYHVEFFNTYKSGLLRKFDLRTETDGTLIISVPRFTGDCAFRVKWFTK